MSKTKGYTEWSANFECSIWKEHPYLEDGENVSWQMQQVTEANSTDVLKKYSEKHLRENGAEQGVMLIELRFEAAHSGAKYQTGMNVSVLHLQCDAT